MRRVVATAATCDVLGIDAQAPTKIRQAAIGKRISLPPPYRHLTGPQQSLGAPARLARQRATIANAHTPIVRL